MTWPNRDDTTRDQYSPHAPPPPAPRRTPWLAIALVAAAVVVLIVGIPVGVLLVRSAGGDPPAPVANAESASGITPADPRPDPTTEPEPPDTEPPDTEPADPGAEAPAGNPQGLTSVQQDLWDVLPLDGVDAASCRGYPPGEAVTPRVAASIECRIVDPGFEEPIYFYSFPDDQAVEEYLAIRAADVDRFGDCESGDEFDGTWTEDDGFRLGRVVCVDNIKDGTGFFKMVWSRDGTGAVAVIQDESASFVFDWWLTHGGNSQFSS